MKAEDIFITNEEAEKIFAQYLGCKCTITEYSRGKLDIATLYFCRQARAKTYKGLSLLVKPISSITDEDAIEVAKMRYEWQIENTLISNDKIVLLGKEFANRILLNELSGAGFVVKIYQYLQREGYALPYMDYSVDDLVKEGIYKLI